MEYRIGQGYDIHQLVENRKLILGGIEIPFEKGLLGHSDADVLVHAIIDAILGAAGLGDIGRLFPDTDQKYKNADSLKLLEAAWKKTKGKGYGIGNIDATVIAQKPRLAPHVIEMQNKLARVLEIDVDRINIKAKSNENLDSVGEERAISAQAVVLLTMDK